MKRIIKGILTIFLLSLVGISIAAASTNASIIPEKTIPVKVGIISSISNQNIKIPQPIASICNSLDNCDLTFISGGQEYWFSQNGYVRSGIIIDNEESWLQTTVTGPGEGSFLWQVSSEQNFDFLEFYIDDVLQSGRISGSVPWQTYSFTVPSGSHTLKWRYYKDGSVSIGADAGYLDNLQYTQTMQTEGITVTSPNGGEDWQAGSKQLVTWTFTGISDSAKVNIDLYQNGAFIKRIKANQKIGKNGDGHYKWKLKSGRTGTGYRIMITTTDGQYSDESDGDFTIS